MTDEEILEVAYLELENLWAEAEAELDRDLTQEERESIVDQYLAGLDDDGEETPMEESTDAI